MSVVLNYMKRTIRIQAPTSIIDQGQGEGSESRRSWIRSGWIIHKDGFKVCSSFL